MLLEWIEKELGFPRFKKSFDYEHFFETLFCPNTWKEVADLVLM